jgi:hypothetical protein
MDILTPRLRIAFPRRLPSARPPKLTSEKLRVAECGKYYKSSWVLSWRQLCTVRERAGITLEADF